MIHFILNNKIIKTAENPGTPLLDFIRYNQHLKGTKIGCREGDCGACTALVGTLSDDGTIKYQSITSCISPLGNAHGKHIVTVEGTNLINTLNEVQLAMKENYATQCGFCTPGFVVSLAGFALSSEKKSYENSIDTISGNICRCTGYNSIKKATGQVCKKLQKSQNNISLEWLVKNNFIPSYFKEIPKKLEDLRIDKLKQSGINFISGGTDLYVQKVDSFLNENVNLIFDKYELNGISVTGGVYSIGAGSTVSDIWKNEQLNNAFPNLKTHLKLVSSEQIRNMASIGGNLINASPIGDMTIFFLALNSSVIIMDSIPTVVGEVIKERRLPLKSLFKSYKKLNMQDKQLIKNVEFFLPVGDFKFNFEKVCKRKYLDIASVNSAIGIYMRHSKIEEIHLSMGGVAEIPKYLNKTCSFLKRKQLNIDIVLKASEIIQSEISPISDVRGSVNYKRLLARQLFFAHFVKLFPNQFKLTDFIKNGKA